ncbi:MAG: methyl-accepting chemotaxis protein [Cellulosilyticum sp.]|nr:methyl-accepting chemotaxis protein [Cellulosilyticum sp.]
MKNIKVKGQSVKRKLIIALVPIVIMSTLLLVLFSYRTSSRMLKAYSKDLLMSSVENQAVQIEAWLNENLASFRMIKEVIEQSKPNEKELQKIIDLTYQINSNYPAGLYIADNQGTVWRADKTKTIEQNIQDCIWYKQGLSRVNMDFGSAYINEQGEKVISASGLLKEEGEKTRVISADVSLNRMAVITNAFISMDGAEAFLVDASNQTILAHRDSQIVSKKLSEIEDNHFMSMIATKFNDRNYDFCTIDGKMTVFEHVGDMDWYLVSYVPEYIVLKDLYQLRWKMLMIGCVAILLLVIIMERMTHRVMLPINSLTKTMEAMAQGDFTMEIIRHSQDEIGIMSESVQGFVSVMKQMVQEIKGVSYKLKGQADESDEVSRRMFDASNLQSDSMNELNVTVDQMAISIGEIAESATQLSEIVTDTKVASEDVNCKMQETVTISEKGRLDMQQVRVEMTNIQETIDKLQGAINNVGNASHEINGIVNLIGNIASETNLLSLNASIEAARAGELGKGFAVVASEIGKLAQNSTDSVAKISGLIEQVNALVLDVVNQAVESAQSIHQSSMMIDRAVTTYEEIFSNIQKTNCLVSNISDRMTKVDEIAINVASISEEQAASSQQIAATAQVMVGQAHHIAENSKQVASYAKSLAETADYLEDQMNQFQI